MLASFVLTFNHRACRNVSDPDCGFGFVDVLTACAAGTEDVPEIYIGSIGEAALTKAAALALELRQSGIGAQFDVVGRSVKAQMKYADKIGARFTAVLGDDDLAAGVAKVKNMESGETQEIPLDGFADEFMEYSLQSAAQKLQNTAAEDMSGVDLSKILGGLI